MALPFVPRYGAGKGDTETLFTLLNSELSQIGGADLQLVIPPADEALLAEQRFQLSGFTSRDQIIDYGNRMDANMILTGFSALFDDELTIGVIIYQTETGRAVSGKTHTIREETFLSDISFLAGEIWADLYRHKAGINRDEIEQLIALGDISEALRLEPLLTALKDTEELTPAVSQELRNIRRDRLLNGFKNSDPKVDYQNREVLFLLLSLSGDNTEVADVSQEIYQEREAAKTSEIDQLTERFSQKLSDHRFEEAEKTLAEIKGMDAPPELVSSLGEELKESRTSTYLSQSRWALLRFEPRSAAYYGYQAIGVDPQNSEAIERTAAAQERLDTAEYSQLIRENQADLFALAERTGLLVELYGGYGAADDALAVMAARGTGIMLGAGLFTYQETLPPLHVELGVGAAMHNREGELVLPDGTIEITASFYDITGSIGPSIRFFGLELGARLKGGGALILATNGGEKINTPGFALSMEMYARRFWNEKFFAGGLVSWSRYYSIGKPVVSAVDLSVSVGYSF